METETNRREWLKVLANAPPDVLETLWSETDIRHSFHILRNPEIGMAMIRGRADGAGRPFNLGEVTISRCVVSTRDSESGSDIMGVGYVRGRCRRHAELVARFDALFQDTRHGPVARNAILPELKCNRAELAAQVSQKAAATRVAFFTMMRGE